MLTLPKSKLTKNGRTIMLALTAIFACLIVAGAYLKIPVSVIPYSMQTFFVQLAGSLLGPLWGAAAVGLYLFIGLIGVPVFTSGGGIMYVLQPTFGYLIGFLIGTVVGGLIIKCFKKKNYLAYFTGNIVNLIISYACGMLYFYLLKSFYLHESVTAYTIFIMCFLIFIPGDLALTFLGSYIAKKVKPILDKHTQHTATDEDIEKFEMQNKSVDTNDNVSDDKFEQTTGEQVINQIDNIDDTKDAINYSEENTFDNIISNDDLQNVEEAIASDIIEKEISDKKTAKKGTNKSKKID